MNFSESFEKLKSALAKEGYKIRIKDNDKRETDTYATYNFKTNKTGGWNFGAWLTLGGDDGYPEVQFFAIHEDNIDKFKPSRAEDCFRFEWIWDSDLWINHALRIVRMVRRHPIISYNMDCYWSQLDYKIPHTLMYMYYKSKALKYKLKVWYSYRSQFNLDVIRLRTAQRRLMKLGLYEKVEIVDNNISDDEMNCICSPRYDLNIHYAKAGYEDTDEELQIKEWIYSQYRWNGKPLENCHVFGYLDGKECGWYYERPQEEYLEEVYGWRYKLYKLLKGDKNE